MPWEVARIRLLDLTAGRPLVIGSSRLSVGGRGRHRRRLIHTFEEPLVDPISTLKTHPRPGILAMMPVVTSAFLIRGDGQTALLSWVLTTVTFITWCAVRLGKPGTWEGTRSSQPEV